MRTWLLVLAGLLVWAVHFFLLYGIGEFAGASTASRVGVILLTLVAIGVNLVLILRLQRAAPGDEFGRWRNALARGGLALSLIAVIWQGLPALI